MGGRIILGLLLSWYGFFVAFGRNAFLVFRAFGCSLG
jgi:hypothetical protein